MIKKHSYAYSFLILILGFLSYNIFEKMMNEEILSDLLAHANSTMELIIHNKLPPRFGYFLTSAFFSGFSTDVKYVLFISSLVLTASVLFKFIISYNYLKKESTVTKYIIALTAFGLCFASHIPNPEFLVQHKWYLLHSVSTVWHNSTIIFSLPFSILLFILSINNLKRFTIINLLGIIALVIINNICKPSFFFAYLPAYFIMLLINFKIYEKKFLLSLIPLFIGISMLAFEYLNVYEVTPEKTSSDGIEFVFFKHYLTWIKQLKVALIHPYFSILLIQIVSFSFPLTMLVIYKKVNREELFCWLLVFFSIIIYSFVRETGFRASHGNFGWQKIPTTYLIFLVYSKSLINNLKTIDWKKRTALFFLTLHILSGFYYYLFIIHTKNFF